MKYCFILIFAFITSGIDSRSLKPSSYNGEALEVHWSPKMNLLRQNKIKEISDSTEVPNDINDLTARESNNEILKSLLNNHRNDQSSQNKKLENLLNYSANNHGDEPSAMQWLKHLKFNIDQFYGENSSEAEFRKNLDDLSDVVESSTPSLHILQTLNRFKDLVDSADGELDIYYLDGQDDNGHVKSRNEDSLASFPLVRNEASGFNLIDSSTADGRKNGRNSTEDLDVMLSELQGQVNRMRKYLDSDCRKYNKSASSKGSINKANQVSISNIQ